MLLFNRVFQKDIRGKVMAIENRQLKLLKFRSQPPGGQ